MPQFKSATEATAHAKRVAGGGKAAAGKIAVLTRASATKMESKTNKYLVAYLSRNLFFAYRGDDALQGKM